MLENSSFDEKRLLFFLWVIVKFWLFKYVFFFVVYCIIEEFFDFNFFIFCN